MQAKGRYRKLLEARARAQANADWSEEPWVVFIDTCGNPQCERQLYQPKDVQCETFVPKSGSRNVALNKLTK